MAVLDGLVLIGEFLAFIDALIALEDLWQPPKPSAAPTVAKVTETKTTITAPGNAEATAAAQNTQLTKTQTTPSASQSTKAATVNTASSRKSDDKPPDGVFIQDKSQSAAKAFPPPVPAAHAVTGHASIDAKPDAYQDALAEAICDAAPVARKLSAKPATPPPQITQKPTTPPPQAAQKPVSPPASRAYIAAAQISQPAAKNITSPAAEIKAPARGSVEDLLEQASQPASAWRALNY